MLKIDRSYYEPIYNDDFPVYWKATDSDLKTALFHFEVFDDDDHFAIVSFDDIKADFDSWTAEDRAEYLQDSDTPDYTVFDWMRDCMMNTLHAVSGFRLSAPTTETVLCDPDGAVTVIQRYGANDYGAWFTDKDHMDDDTFGSSVRGPLLDVIDEVREVM